MAHQDFSKICPIFKEGVEKELNIPVNVLTASLDVGGVGCCKFGREVEIVEVGTIARLSTGASATTSLIFSFFKGTDASNSVSVMLQLGSLSTAATYQSTATGGTKTGCAWISAQTFAAPASAAFTSTDTFWVGVNGGAAAELASLPGIGHTIVVRYRDK